MYHQLSVGLMSHDIPLSLLPTLPVDEMVLLFSDIMVPSPNDTDRRVRSRCASVSSVPRQQK